MNLQARHNTPSDLQPRPKVRRLLLAGRRPALRVRPNRRFDGLLLGCPASHRCHLRRRNQPQGWYLVVRTPSQPASHIGRLNTTQSCHRNPAMALTKPLSTALRIYTAWFSPVDGMPFSTTLSAIPPAHVLSSHLPLLVRLSHRLRPLNRWDRRTHNSQSTSLSTP